MSKIEQVQSKKSPVYNDMIRALLIISVLFTSSNCIICQNWSDSISTMSSDTKKLDFLKSKIESVVYSNPQSAFQIASLHDSIASLVGDDKYLAQALNMQGMAHYVNGRYETAIEYYVDALEYYEAADDKNTLARVYNNLATCYQIREDNQTSSKYFLKALELYESLQDSIWIANINSNLGLQYLNDEILDKAEKHLRDAIIIYEKLDNETYLGIALLSRGNLRVAQERYKEAIVDYKGALEKVPEQVSPLAQAAASGGMGTAYNRLGNISRAKDLLTESFDKAKAINSLEQQKEAARELAELHFKIGQFKPAYEYQAEYIALKDSAFTQEQDQRLVEAMTKYETVKKEKEIEKLNASNELRSSQLKARQRQLIIVSIGSLVLLGLLFAILRLYKKLNAQNVVIEKALGEKDTLLREIHHRVKNNLQVISSLLALQSKYVKDGSALDALHQGQDRVQSMALIHQDLYQHDNLKGVDTQDYLEELIENLLDSYQIEEGSIDVETDIDSVLLDVDTMIPLGLIINELVSNSLKHAFSNMDGARIEVTLKDEKDQLFLRVRDNGVGVKDFHAVEDSSFGFSLIKSFAHKLEADIEVNPKAGFCVDMHIKNIIRA